MAKRDIPEINAGSMADIAFLLLIFFLVTTTMDTDSGVFRKLPEIQPEDLNPPPVKQKNIFEVNINRFDQLLVEDEEVKIGDIRQLAIDFIDNGGGKTADGKACDYCEGNRADDSSDHPSKAIIAVQTAQTTSYGMYISVQNELLAAYTELRNRYAKKYLTGKYKGLSYTDLLNIQKADKENLDVKAALTKIKEAYPEILSDAEPIK
ncbi:biopolymer transporter ExbD [Wenyingzhuangia sp. 2_MG-2023]|uniref:ExbD/TolR family protein n=1 Tax=Wenyingzhuangia sp. 2_MG-2023 TaxID=3062639 RepID=UPI0026E46839|nr:biopolymer transporter ExbD [Wenyingzhuangia sp. 2_MG-2023]MDO6738177.1 biopolymer transporter ExbD [Wenyingzhuangia sp. 2_MG-2023]MDO6801499.1 biopolymer transporter ExbD [Wenyingzhuangia sp. 1_MG-2023]